SSFLAAHTLQFPLYLALRVARRDVAPLVPHLLALRERKLDLDLPALEVEARRHDGETLLRNARCEPLEFLAVEEKFARPVGVVVRAVPLGVLGHVEAD